MPTATRRKPITDDTRFGLTPQGAAALDASIEQAQPDTCPICSDRLRTINCYTGGVGYVPYALCVSTRCNYARRIL